MRRLLVLGSIVGSLILTGCTGGADGDPEDDIGDIIVLTHSPGNGDELGTEDSIDGFNALNNPTLTNPGAVTIQFTNSLNTSSVLLPPGTPDPQGTRNIRLFYFDTSQGPFDPQQPTVPGVNPPGANVLVEATSIQTTTDPSNIGDTVIIRPKDISATSPLPEGQYSVIVETGVKGADGDAEGAAALWSEARELYASVDVPAGDASIAVDGRMVERLHLDMARKTLARAGADKEGEKELP